MKTLKQPTSVNYTATSFHDVVLYTSPSNLIEICEIFDIIYHENNTGEDKCNYDFDFYIPSEDIYFTVYDWKEYEPLNPYTNYEFHIGSKDQASSFIAKEILEELLVTY